jgi:hypothetical protein
MDFSIARDDRGMEMLDPDLMTPDQFFGLLRGTARTGERKLMAAVLQDGIETFQKNASARDPIGRELFDEARAWILARHDPSLFSFTTVCDVLELDANALRAGLLRWLARTSATKSAAPPAYRSFVGLGGGFAAQGAAS